METDGKRYYSIEPLGYSVEYGTSGSTIRLDHSPSKRTLTLTPNFNREPSEPIEMRLSEENNEIIGAILQDWARSL